MNPSVFATAATYIILRGWRSWTRYSRIVGVERANPHGFYIWAVQTSQLRRAQPRLLRWWAIVPMFFAGVWLTGGVWPLSFFGWCTVTAAVMGLLHHHPPAEATAAVNRAALERDARYAATRYGY